MAKFGNFQLDPAPCPLPNFDCLAFDENNRVGLKVLTAECSADLLIAHTKAQMLMREKMKQTLSEGRPNPTTLAQEKEAWSAYTKIKWDLLDDEANIRFTEAVHRGDLSVEPVEVPGRNTLAHPFPGANAAMAANHPGYDEAHRAFLLKHRAANHFPKRLAMLGGLFVSAPDMTFDQNMDLLRDMRRAHPHFVDAPEVTVETTKRELMQILAHYDPDMPAAVVRKRTRKTRGKAGAHEQNELIGWVWRKGDDEDKKNEYTKVGSFFQPLNAAVSHSMEAPSISIKPEDAYLLLRESSKDFMYRTDDAGVHQVMTKTTAALSTLLPPFVFQEGLGSVVYLGISDPDETMRQLEEYVAFGVAGVVIETAHADRDDVIKVLRRARLRFPKLFIICGTVTNPDAVAEMLEFADCVKVGIAEGGHCKTNQTGVGIPQAWAGIACGLAAEGRGTIIVDSWGTTREFVLGLSFHNARARQAGASLAARAESAMPFIMREDGVRGKMVRGEASAPADGARSKRKKNGNTLRREMADRIHPYWEGEERFNPLKDPPTIGEWMWLCKQRLLSAMSYAGVRKFDKSRPPLRQFQEESTVYIVPPVRS